MTSTWTRPGRASGGLTRQLRRVRGEHGPGDRGADASTSSDASLARYDAMLAEEARACDVPADLLRAICWYASGWRQFEPGGRVLSTPTAHGTSYGCMQLNDHWHPDAFPEAMTDPRASIRYAASLLFWLKEQTGSWNRATVAFFGHDRRAENAARRVRRYVQRRPWTARLADGAPAAAPAAGEHASAGVDSPLGEDLYADLAQ